MFLLPAAGSRRERVYSTRSGELWSSRRRALGCCSCANTSASGSSGTRPRSSSLQTRRHRGLLGRERRPTAPRGRAGRLKRDMTGSYIISFSEGVTNLSFGPFSEADMCVPEELVKCIIIEQNVGSMRKPIEEIGNGKCAPHRAC